MYRRLTRYWFALHPPCAYATVTITNTLQGLTWTLIGVLFFISTLAGLASLLYRMDHEVRVSGKPITAPILFGAVNMVGAWTAAMLGFFIAEGLDLGDWTELGVILLSSFGGARVLEKAADNYLNRYLGVQTSSVAAPPPPAPPQDGVNQ